VWLLDGEVSVAIDARARRGASSSSGSSGRSGSRTSPLRLAAPLRPPAVLAPATSRSPAPSDQLTSIAGLPLPPQVGQAGPGGRGFVQGSTWSRDWQVSRCPLPSPRLPGVRQAPMRTTPESAPRLPRSRPRYRRVNLRLDALAIAGAQGVHRPVHQLSSRHALTGSKPDHRHATPPATNQSLLRMPLCDR